MALGCCDEASGIDRAEEALQAALGLGVGPLDGGLCKGRGTQHLFMALGLLH